MSVSPNNVTLKTLSSQVFTANGADQFGTGMNAGNVTWTAGGASIGSGGALNYTAPGTLGTVITITAANGQVRGSATVNLVDFNVSGAKAFPVPYKANEGTGVIHFAGLGTSSKIRIYTTSGRQVFSIALSQQTYDWPIVNSSGENIASGVYFYVIESPEGKKDGKLIIIK